MNYKNVYNPLKTPVTSCGISIECIITVGGIYFNDGIDLPTYTFTKIYYSIQLTCCNTLVCYNDISM